MSTKEKLLSLLEENKGTYFSGGEIAEKFSVSRTAVWKAVNSLRSEGYEIDAVQNKGYRLSVDTDILSVQGIRKYLRPICSCIRSYVLPTARSTNALIREQANAGAPEGYTVIANTQTEGRGRLGRSFYSPADTGIYMSVLLRPKNCPASQAAKITTMAAVAASEAIEEVSAGHPKIKWVNDIYINGKKVSGILTEASLGLETGSVDHVALGIGINVYPPKDGFPKSLGEIAGAVFPGRTNDGKNQLAAGFLNHFMDYYFTDDHSAYIKKYRERSLVIGKEIQVLSPSGQKNAYALDIDEDCSLIVQYGDGRTERLSFGEISIKYPRQEGNA